VAQIIAPIVSTGVEKGSAAVSVEETLMVHPKLEVATTQDVICKAPVVTSEMKELLVLLAYALMGVTNVPPLTSESIPVKIVETGSMSMLAKPAPAVDILEDLILHMIE